MKILHTSDWHLGRKLKEISLIEEQHQMLEQIKNIITKENIEVLLISGDVFDKAIPSSEAVNLLDEFLSKIVLEMKTKVVIISGNHDSSDRLGFASRLMEGNGLFMQTKIEKEIRYVDIEDVRFHLLPYFEPSNYKMLVESEESLSYDECYSRMLECAQLKESSRNIILSHGFIVGQSEMQLSESERHDTVGTIDSISYSYFEKFDYAALGHLHRHQRAGHEKIRYSGSPLKYSFSEASHKKGVVILDTQNLAESKFMEIKALKDLRVIKGKLGELISQDVYSLENREDYIHAVLTDQEELYEPMAKLRQVYPNILSMEIEKKERPEEIISFGSKNKTLKELVMQFYEFVNSSEMEPQLEKISDQTIVKITGGEAQ